ncbi:MAG: DUF697 domain-containing protein [Planctomycetaceae bacterium]|nr:DUF697 domain-containing protein [Planctomycetaceae bacterium]
MIFRSSSLCLCKVHRVEAQGLRSLGFREAAVPIMSRLAAWFAGTPMSDEEFARERQRLLQKTPLPVFWLFGKTGSGKTSIVRYLTGATDAEIGNGFRPQTKLSSEYEFPSVEQPIVKFLDTRGLGEAHYDPQEDLAKFADSTHLMIVTARVTDQALEPILTPLRVIRQQQPTRPVVLALTCLHEAYPRQQHPFPDPFVNHADWPPELPGDLRRCLVMQQERFAGLVDRIVPIDLTPADEGFHVPEFGGERLDQTLQELLPAAFRQTLVLLHDVHDQLQDLTARKAWPIIVSYSSLAATAAATPLPLVDIPAVLAIQSRMVYVLADLYGQKFQADLVWKMAAALGGQILARFAIRAPLKFIPFVGMTANAALSFAYTVSLGKACCWYFSEIKAGHVPTEDDLKSVWGEKLQEALQVWKRGDASKPVQSPNA